MAEPATHSVRVSVALEQFQFQAMEQEQEHGWSSSVDRGIT
jgi:hypothetical protein